MSRFSIRYPYLIVVICLIVGVVGITSAVRMPVDLFPPIKIPVVVVATFYSGMPPEQIENDITGTYERFFTLASGINHIESRSLPGISLIKIYFEPGTDADSDVTGITNLAMANLRRLPPGTLPPVVLKFDASSLPVCLITLKGEGLNETQLHDVGQYNVRNQVAGVPGCAIPPPFGGKLRQIQIYVDPVKMQARQLSLMDVFRGVNAANLILPAGDVKIGPFDYSLYTNSQLATVDEINRLPLKMYQGSPVLVGDIGRAADDAAIQTNIVRIDGQRSVYLPILKSSAEANTIAVVSGIKDVVARLIDIPKALVSTVVFDQSVFVRSAIENLADEGLIGLVLTGLMILVFLGNVRATFAVFLSIPLSVLATFIALQFSGSSVNAMVLGGLALAFSRLIDNSVIVLENIFRHMELGESPEVAAEKGGNEGALAVLAATLTTVIVFFPVTFLFGVSKFLFSALALAVALSLFASYFVAMSVVPLFCAKLIRAGEVAHGGSDPSGAIPPRSPWGRFNRWFNARFHGFLKKFDRAQAMAIARPAGTVVGILGIFVLSLGLWPAVGLAYFPRTDPGQFVINLKAAPGTRVELTEKEVTKVEAIVRRVVSPSDLRIIVSNIGSTPDLSSLRSEAAPGTRVELTEKEVTKVEAIVRRVVSPSDLRIIVSNIGSTPDLSSIYTSNSAPNTAFVQVSLNDSHKVGSFAYMDRMRAALRQETPELTTDFQSGGLVDAALNQGIPAPIDVQVSSNNLDQAFAVAEEIRSGASRIPGVSDVFIPQDVHAPSLELDINRYHAIEMGLSEHEVVDNVITALTSNGMIAPSYWVDPKSGNLYMLTVQYPDNTVKSLADLRSIPIRSPIQQNTAMLDTIADVKSILTPTEVDHYQLRRVIDVYVSPQGEELDRVAKQVGDLVSGLKHPADVIIRVRGIVGAMNSSFRSFAIGLILSVVLVYLVLVAQFKSFLDPLLILLAVPPGLTGVLIILTSTGTTLNIMSLMGVVMMVGVVVSNSILIVEFTHRLIADGMPLKEAVQFAARVRLRPILMTSLATIIGLIPMALALGAGSESYSPLARSIIGGMIASVVLTVFIVPSAFYIAYRGRIPAVRDDRPCHGTSGNGP